jgi:hypothetical protein
MPGGLYSLRNSKLVNNTSVNQIRLVVYGTRFKPERRNPSQVRILHLVLVPC